MKDERHSKNRYGDSPDLTKQDRILAGAFLLFILIGIPVIIAVIELLK
ncbi:hypothetical protein [uncultured Mediterranean phage]|nr:hypothetical protein [uncultured Mediterranean phage]